MSTKRKINDKDIVLLKVNLCTMFKIMENDQYNVIEDEYGFQINIVKYFAGIENAISILHLMSGLFCNFGFSSCVYGHTNTTHAEEEIKLEMNFKYLQNLPINNQYEVSEKTIKTASGVLQNLVSSLNTVENRKQFNDFGNVEVYSDSNKFIWIDVFVKSNKVSLVCKENSVSVVYPLVFDISNNFETDTISKFVSVMFLTK